MAKTNYERDMEVTLQQIAQALGLEARVPDADAVIAAARQAAHKGKIPEGFVVLHQAGFLEAADKAFQGSRETLTGLIERNTWAPAPN